jgi:CubicO group peptidase (beta-lactamase class C family)
MDVQERIQAVEQGLLPVVFIRGRPRKRTSLADRMAELKIPGVSIAVINDGRIEWAKGYGVLEAGGAAVDQDSMFQACSISKPLSATGVLVLVERGLLDLDQPVNERLVSWKLPENEHTKEHPVTARWLLSHRAGTTVHGFPGYPVGAPLPTLQQILDGVLPANTAPVRVEKTPGAQFQYSGGGTMIIQQLIEDTTRRRFADFVRETVLDPLGLTRSTYQQPLPQRLAGNAATGHRNDGTPLEGNWFVLPELAAAGLWTTPSDLARWAIELQLIYNGQPERMLSQRMAREMLTVQGDGPTGLGPFLAGDEHALRFSHGGSNQGYRCDLVAYAGRGQGAVVMTSSDAGDRICWEILNGIADVYGWPGYLVEKDVVAMEPQHYDRYTGAYEVNPDFTITVRRDGNRLLGETSAFGSHEIFPESETEFFLTEVAAQVSFDLDDSGRASGLLLRAMGFEFRARRVD